MSFLMSPTLKIYYLFSILLIYLWSTSTFVREEAELWPRAQGVSANGDRLPRPGTFFLCSLSPDDVPTAHE